MSGGSLRQDASTVLTRNIEMDAQSFQLERFSFIFSRKYDLMVVNQTM